MLIKVNDVQYSELPGVRKSQLDLLNISPALVKKPVHFDTQAMVLGSAVHCMVLTPDLFDELYCVAPDVDLRTKVGKEQYAEFLLSVDGKNVLTESLYGQALGMKESVITVIGDYLDTPDAEFETAAIWKDADTGVNCKCRVDCYIPSLGLAIDLKTTGGASTADDFGKSVKAYRYHVQQSFYTQGLRANGYPVMNFLFVTVSKQPGNVCRAFMLDDEMVSVADSIVKADLDLWRHCEESGSWERKPSQIERIKFKPWEITENEF